MAAKVKSYFLAPNWDYQKNGPLSLGNIISDPRDPVFSQLSTFETVQALAKPEIYHNPPESWSHVTSHSRSHEFGIFIRFLETLGIGPDAGLATSSERYRGSSYTMDSIQTSYFVPEPSYILSRLRDPQVSLFLDSRKFFRSKSLYIITGIRVARGLAIRTANSTSTTLGADTGASLMPIGVPASTGLEGKIGWGKGVETAVCKNPADVEVVFAYQLRRITVKGKIGQERIENKPFNKAAFMSSEDQRISENSKASEFEGVNDFEIDNYDASLADVKDEDSEEDRNTLCEVDAVADGEPCKLITYLS